MNFARPDFFSVHTVAGRKDYRCALCPRPIAKKEQHVHVSACSAGRFWDNRYHLACYPEQLPALAPIPREIPAAVVAA